MRTITSIKSWQEKALSLGCPSRYFLIQSPGGAGKSLLQVMLAQADIEDTGNKQLILVPKNHIHHGFFDEKAIQFTLPGHDEPSQWVVKSNFCSKSNSLKTKLLKDFLLADIEELSKAGRLAAISTHQAMVRTWMSMSGSEKKQALHNVSFRIDEAHHVSHVFHDTDLDEFNENSKKDILDDATGLGHFLQDVMRQDSTSVKVHLATATFFRGDRRTILSEEFKKEFVHFYLPWDEHFANLGIEQLTFDFVTYDDTPMDSMLGQIEKEPNERHLIIVPPLTRRFRTPDTLGQIIEGLRCFLPNSAVLDLVTPETQEQNKQSLQKHPDQYRAVVACRLFDEGTDWVPCTRLHNTDACEGSVTLAVQRIYRPLRQHAAKKNVRIINYLPSFFPNVTPEGKRIALSNRFTTYLACMIAQGDLKPSLVKVKGGSRNTERSEYISLQEVYGTRYPDVLEALIKEYEAVQDKKNPLNIEAVAQSVLTTFGIPDAVEPDDLKDALLCQLVRIGKPKVKRLDSTSLELAGIDAESIRQEGFDKVWKKVMPDASILCMGTDNIDATTIKEFLEFTRRIQIREIPTLEEIHNGIRAYHKRTGLRPDSNSDITELGRSGRAVSHILNRHYDTALAAVVRNVLGKPSDGLLERARAVIKDYWTRGVRLTNQYGGIPELQLTTLQLNMQLRWHHKTTLAKEVEKIAGPRIKKMIGVPVATNRKSKSKKTVSQPIQPDRSGIAIKSTTSVH